MPNKTRWVQATADFTNGGKVVLWERDESHPNGEIFIGDGNPVEVAETGAVMERIRSGALVWIDAPSKADQEKAHAAAATTVDPDPDLDTSVVGTTTRTAGRPKASS